MTKMMRKSIAIMMAAVITMMLMSSFAYADDDTQETEVYITQPAVSYDFSVTESITFTGEDSSNDLTADGDLEVTNNSAVAKVKYDLELTAESDYTVKDYDDTTWDAEEMDSKSFGIKAGDHDMIEKYEDVEEIEAGDSDTLTLSGKAAASTSAVTSVKMATLTVTAKWV